MKRLLPLVLVLIPLAGATAWWLTRTSTEPSETSSALAPGAADDSGRDAAGTGEPDALASGAERAPEGTIEATPASAPKERVAGSEAARRDAERNARWIEGTVLAPQGCALDGDLEVFAMEGGFHVDALHSAALALRRGETLPKWAREGSLVSAPVGPDGSFQLPLDPAIEAPHVSVLGSTQYIVDAVPWTTDGQTLEPMCGGVLHGRVLPPLALDGQDVGELSDVTLTLSSRIEPGDFNLIQPGSTGFQPVDRDVEVEADGTFEFRGVPASHKLELSTDCERFAVTTLNVEPLEASEQRTQDLHLLLGGTIAGRVVNERGEPIEGAEVRALGDSMFFGFGKRELREAETDHDGTFELKAVPSGTVRLVADAARYLESDEQKLKLTEGGRVDGATLVLSDGTSLAGTLTWADGRPAAGVDVRVRFDQSMMFGMTAFNAQRGATGRDRTDDEGLFRVTGLGKGPFTVTAEAAPRTSAASAENGDDTTDEDDDGPKWKAREDGVQPDSHSLALVLQEPALLKGRVVDQDGEPVTTFEIAAEQPGEGLLGNLGLEKAKDAFDDEDGRFALEGLIPGAWEVYAMAEGYGVPDPITVTLPQAAGDELLLQIVRAASVAGTVLSDAGEPVADATVEVDLGGPVWQAQLQPQIKRPTATSQADGTFLLEGVTPGAVTLRARHNEHAPSEPVQLELAVGEEREEVTISLRIGATLTGEVYDDDGELSSGRMVQVTKLDNYETEVTTTDGDGAFKIEHMEPGTWQVVAMPAGFASGEVAAEEASSDDEGSDADSMLDMMSKIEQGVADLVDGQTEHVVLGAPPEDPVQVTGTVTHDGEPYAGALVTFYAEGENTMQSLRNVKVKNDGSFAVELDGPGTYVAQVQMLDDTMTQQRIVEFSRKIPETEAIELHFEIPTGRVSGSVEGPDGSPLSGVRVSLHPEGALEVGTLWGGQYAEAATDDRGQFDFQGLRPGRYSLMAGGMSYGGMVSDRASFGRQARTILIEEGRWLDGETFRLETPGKIEVSVVDATGQPVPEAAVFVRDDEGHILDRLSMITTDSGGQASYGGIEPGDYTVTVRRGELASQESAAVRVHGDETTEVTIRLEASTLLLITLQGEEGELLNANVSVRDAAGREVSGMLALTELLSVFGQGFSSKEHRVGPLPPGRYKVVAELPDGRSVKKPVTLSGRPERKMTLKFRK